jgi:CMP-N-acetylneuraminic acid synthetase
MVQFRPNSIHRRQDLEPIFYHDSAVIVVSRSSLDAAAGNPDPHAFFGADRRAVLQSPEDAVDIDTLTDLLYAEAVIRVRNEAVFADPPTAGFRQPPFTAAVSCGGSYDRR